MLKEFDAEWRLAETARVNVHFIGIQGIDEIADLIRSDHLGPVTTWHPGDRFELPPAGQTGTLVLHQVGALAHVDQHRLFDWLQEPAGRTQVISTTSETLLPLIERGIFLEALYYRINTVCLTTTGSEPESRSFGSCTAT